MELGGDKVRDEGAQETVVAIRLTPRLQVVLGFGDFSFIQEDTPFMELPCNVLP